MDQRIKELWIKALRSGEFEQCRYHLENDGKYCALGVLSVIAMVEGFCTFEKVNDVGRFDNPMFTLSYNVMKWANIAQDGERYLDPKEHQVKVRYKQRFTTIQDLNDEGLSFKELASIIEQSL